MMKFNLDNPDIDLLIRQYLKGQLSLEDTKNFDQALLEDEPLKNEVALVRKIQGSLQLQRRAETKKMLERIAVEHPVEEIVEDTKSIKSPSVNKGLLLLIAGAILSITSLLFWLFQPLSISEENTPIIFKNYYQAFQLAGAYDPQVLNKTNQALSAYNLEKPDYPKVVDLLQDYPGATDEMDILMALSIAYIETNEWTKAEKVLTIISQDTADSYTQDGQWYLALVQLRQGKTNEARQLLKILQDHERYGSDARDLLSQLPINRFSKYTQ